MPEHKDVARTHRFDLINSKLELPLDDIARHIEVSIKVLVKIKNILLKFRTKSLYQNYMRK